MHRIINHAKNGIRIFGALFLLLGVIIPALFTMSAQLLFPTAANGSLIERNGKVIGSELLGQQFSKDKYFWGRLSATVPPYNAAASASSNLSFMNRNIFAMANDRLAALKGQKNIPLVLITASGSGLDPHLPPEAVQYQVARVAAARKMSVKKLKDLVEVHTEQPHLGMIGMPRVNILLLNLALDAQ